MKRQPRILVVDDDPDVRDTLVEVLLEEGYEVVSAGNGREALELLLNGSRPDVILLDMMMPVMDGWAFRAEQRQRAALADIPVVLVTAHTLPREAAERLEPDGLLQKPLRLTDLLVTVERVRSRAA